MNQIFDEQLQLLINTQYRMNVDSINSEGIRVYYTISFLQVDDFMLTATHDNYEDDYVTDTDYSNLISDFSNDTILEITIYHDDEIIKNFKEKIPVDYTRKIPKIVEDCPICLDSLIIDICANRKCKHLYHCECISKWNNDSCPVCRRQLDLYKIQDVDDYRKTAEFTFGKESEIKYLQTFI